MREDDFSVFYKGQPIVIFGAGTEGALTKQILEKNGYNVYAFADNNPKKWGGLIDATEIMSPEVLAHQKDTFFWIIASTYHGHEIYQQILSSRYAQRENVFLPMYGTLFALCGTEYFDCPNVLLEDGGVFADLGVYDGVTSKQVAKMCNYSKIIGFEANSYMYEKSKENLRDLKDVIIYPYAAWDKKEELKFHIADSGSAITDQGEEVVLGESLDNILQGERVTFIKMDIEGAEGKALIGARSTIAKWKPKLAISLYHKPEDVFEIPSIIMDIRDDYKFYIRHYASVDAGTCLYAY